MDGRKRLSGAQYNKLREEKKSKFDKVLNETKKIYNFFKPSASASGSKSNLDDQNQDEKIIEQPEQDSNSDSESIETGNDLRVNEELTNEIEKTEDEKTEDEKTEDEFTVDKDPMKWNINDKLRDYFTMNGFGQNINDDFSASRRTYDQQNRFFSKNMFYKRLKNGKNVFRSWLVYSNSTGNVFCGTCRLFSNSGQVLVQEGFNDWKNAYSRFSEHENSDCHKNCVVMMKERGDILGRIDVNLVQQLNDEISYWKHVLNRVVVVIQALASRGLPFRGNDEKFGSIHNGNYMMMFEVG